MINKDPISNSKKELITSNTKHKKQLSYNLNNKNIYNNIEEDDPNSFINYLNKLTKLYSKNYYSKMKLKSNNNNNEEEIINQKELLIDKIKTLKAKIYNLKKGIFNTHNTEISDSNNNLDNKNIFKRINNSMVTNNIKRNKQSVTKFNK